MSEIYNKAWETFVDECGEDTPDLEVEFASAWIACKKEVLKILSQPLQNADLSVDICDKRYIEQIEKL